nr:MAG TPA: hypothetical protein [Crassvirales sp.]
MSCFHNTKLLMSYTNFTLTNLSQHYKHNKLM